MAVNFSDTTPAAPGAGVNVKWQQSGATASAYLDEVSAVPTSPADATQFLNGAATPAFAHVTDAALSTSDVTTNNASSTKHGFAPKSPADATQFLNGAATPAYAQVKDSDLATTDVTSNNVTSTKHGFTPKSPADATQFLNGAATPAYAASEGFRPRDEPTSRRTMSRSPSTVSVRRRRTMRRNSSTVPARFPSACNLWDPRLG
jgi:hypothetical protein